MNKFKLLTAWLCLPLSFLALALALLLWQQRKELIAQETELTAAETKAATLQSQLSSLDARKTSVSQKETSSSQAASAPDPVLAEHKRERAELKALFERQYFRRNALQSYIAGLDALHLSPAALNEVKETLLRLWKEAEQARKGMKTPEEIATTIPGIRARREAALSALLGPTAYENLEASTKVSSIDWTIGTDLWDAGVPLSPEQLQALAVAQRRTKYQDDLWIFPPTESQIPDPATGLSAQDQALLTNSATFLSPAQQSALRQHLLEDHQYNTAMRGFSAKQRKLWDAQK